jgi:nitrite reductase/ring-hydroxylating ferredoxin subunit
MSDDFDRALDRVAADRSPLDNLSQLSAEERQMVRMAQLLRGSGSHEMRPGFREELHGRLMTSSRRISRRTAFLGGIGTLAAGVLAGLGLDRVLNRPEPAPVDQPGFIHIANGRWVAIARVADVPDGAIRTFKAGAIQGFVMRRGDEFRALSRICTHMACTLNFEQSDQMLVCPCHGAEFNLQGKSVPSLDYGYRRPLPPLPRVQVRTNGEHVEVWTA